VSDFIPQPRKIENTINAHQYMIVGNELPQRPEMNSSSWLRSFRPSISPLVDRESDDERISRRWLFQQPQPVSMTNPTDRVEIITSVQRRRRWTAFEKVRMVEETFESGMTVSLVARRHGVAPNQLFTWRRRVAQGGLTAAGSGEEVVPASNYRALQN
jgi:transposase-like protein